MEKIKLTGSEQLYEIQSIRPTSEHVLQIILQMLYRYHGMETS